MKLQTIQSMKQQGDFDPNNAIIRSGARIRESVRSLPKGHFQQIRQMFDKPVNSSRKLSTIYERQQKSFNSSSSSSSLSSSNLLLRLPVTDDEKLQRRIQTNPKKSFEEHYRDYLAEYQAFRLKLTEELNEHKRMYPCKPHEQLLTQSISLPVEIPSIPKVLSHATSLPEQSPLLSSTQSIKRRQLAMSSAVNYTDSYDTSLSTPLNRTGSSRQYVSSLQQTLTVHAKPASITTPLTCHVLKRNPHMMSNETNPPVSTSQRLHSSTSLSSTGYDSNSSPSMKSQRNSIATSNSNDLIIHSTGSSSSSSASTSSSDEHHQQLLKPWTQYESNPSIYHDEAFESSYEPSPVISRTEIQINQATFLDQHPPISIVRHGSIHNSISSSQSILESVEMKKPNNGTVFTLQTTTFPERVEEKTDRKIRRRKNVYPDRIEAPNTPMRTRKYPLTSTNSTGFQVQDSTDRPPINTFPVTTERKSMNEREENSLSAMESPHYSPLPPKKPPRTFQAEHSIKTTDQKVPSSTSSNSSSPTFDLGTRSVSCMDLTASASNVLLSNNALPSSNDETSASRRTSIITTEKQRKSSLVNDSSKTVKITPVSKENRKRDSSIDRSRDNPSKSIMKKGVSEPNLTKRSRSKSPFTPRALFDRFKRFFPLNSSKQSLNQHDSDDSASISSEHNDHLRTSRLDHVSRVQTVYDSLSTGNQMSNLLLDPIRRSSNIELPNLYDYVVQIIPEQEMGYFSHGNGCISTSHFHSQLHEQSSSSVIFKYPPNALDELSLQSFCFPDQYDANNNPLFLTKKSTQEYFRFALTNMHGFRQYGYCSRFFHKGKLNALCIVSPCDRLEMYEKILSTATELFISYKDEEARKFLEEIYAHRIPNRGDTIHIDTSTVGLYTLKCELDRRKELIDSVTLLGLSTDTIIKIFSAILYEQKLIFISSNLGPLTRLINTFVCLLYPFSWPHTYVPILPSIMLDIIQAPTPYIVGILRSCESYLSNNDDLLSQDNSDIIIVDIDQDRIRSIADYFQHGNENLATVPIPSSDNPSHGQILPKIFKIELKQEISLLRKNRMSFSLDECQQRLRDVFMSIFVQSCYNYREFFREHFLREEFVQSKQHTIELFLEWFTRTHIFGLFIREQIENKATFQSTMTFDAACEKYRKTISKQTPQRITAKAVKRKSATRANKQN